MNDDSFNVDVLAVEEIIELGTIGKDSWELAQYCIDVRDRVAGNEWLERVVDRVIKDNQLEDYIGDLKNE